MTLVMIDDDTDAQVIARVPVGDARREATLRDLLHDHPQVLPVHDLDPSYGRLFTVARELNLPGVGFVDLLLADERGRLVVVECKLWRNPQARREVVGQVLDYARELARYGYEDLQRQVSIATGRHGNVLHAMACAAGGTLDEARFVDRVTRDLTAGRFLLLVVGDGIAEGTRRIGEYLAEQPGLAFGFGLVEIAEYRHEDAQGRSRTFVQPRVLARAAVIERHVIRSEVPGLVVDALAGGSGADGQATSTTRTPSASNGTSRDASASSSEASAAWSRFVERFVAETRFDDPGQPATRRGGNGWLRVPLPGGLYVNAYRSLAQRGIGAQVRFAGTEGLAAHADLLTERDAIDAELRAAGLEPAWLDGEVPALELTHGMALPWDERAEDEQRAWLGAAANQLVNSLRPRLLAREAGRGA